MKFSAQLDVNVVAVESTDEVSVLLDLQSPEVAPDEDRAVAALQVVLDRSGSMAGAPLEGAIKALCGLVARLDERDNFGVVAFHNSTQVVVPAGPLADKPYLDRVFVISSSADSFGIDTTGTGHRG